MRYEIESASGHHVVELDVRKDGVLAQVDGRSYELKIFQPEAGLYTLLIGNQVIEAWVERDPINSSMSVFAGHRAFNLRVSDRKHRRRGSDHGGEGRVSVVARMPGKVVRLLARAGDRIAAGEGILVLEAMKMQNEVKSPKTGMVVEMSVREGQTINAGESLAIVE